MSVGSESVPASPAPTSSSVPITKSSISDGAGEKEAEKKEESEEAVKKEEKVESEEAVEKETSPKDSKVCS